MKLATTIAQTIVRVFGPIQIGLGVLFWTANAFNLIQLHMLIGLIIVLALWVLAALALRAGVHLGLVSAAFAWGILVIALGMTQTSILPGAYHWVVQVVHLAFGLAAMGFAEVLARRTQSRLAAPLPRATTLAGSARGT